MKQSDVFKPKQPRHTIPAVQPRNPDAVEVIEGGVWQWKNQGRTVLLMDDPEGRWLQCQKPEDAELVKSAHGFGAKVRVTVRGMNVLEMEKL